jgi:hypothetical protein
MTKEEAFAIIEDANTNIAYYQRQIETEQRRADNAKLASGLYVMNRNGKMVRVEAA